MKTLIKNFIVTTQNTAKNVGSGELEVLATPTMISWMENTAMTLAQDHLQKGETTVGISISIQHTKASPIGENISCIATETNIEGRKITYKIECKDSKENIIGTGIHERFIVNSERFMSKLN